MGAEPSKEDECKEAYEYEYVCEYESPRKNRNHRQQNRQRMYKQEEQYQEHQQWRQTQYAGYVPAENQYTSQTSSHHTQPFAGSHRNSGGSNYSSQNERGGNREKNRTKTFNIPDGAHGQPPKYEDIFKQPQTQQSQRKQTSGNYKRAGGVSQSRPSEGSLGDRGPRNINALNDLIRKEFGSVGGSTQNMPNVDMTDKLFSGRNRLYLGNLSADIKREDVNKLMSPFGEIVIDYYNHEKHFGFVRLKHREQAENAQRALDGYVFRGRTLRVRLANKNACFKVRNLSPLVTNELLKKAFSSFGEVERAEIMVDDGKATGEGYLEFADKRAGHMALAACVEGCFILTKSLRPVILEQVDPDNGQRGYSEKQLQKNDAEYKKEREVGPRFLHEGTSEYACALLWKDLCERRRCDEEKLAKKYKLEEDLLLENVESLIGNVNNVRID